MTSRTQIVRTSSPVNPLAVGTFVLLSLAGISYLAASVVTGVEHGYTPIRAACGLIGVWLVGKAIAQWGDGRIAFTSWLALLGVLTNFVGATSPVFDSQGLRVAALLVATAVAVTSLLHAARSRLDQTTRDQANG